MQLGDTVVVQLQFSLMHIKELVSWQFFSVYVNVYNEREKGDEVLAMPLIMNDDLLMRHIRALIAMVELRFP